MGYLRAYDSPKREGLIPAGPEATLACMASERRYRHYKRILDREDDMTEPERIRLARDLASTPDQRWQRLQTYLRSHGFSKPCAKRKSASKSQA